MGRRGSILLWSGIFTIGTAIQTGTETSIVQITIGRFIAGLGVGALSGTLVVGLISCILLNIPRSYRAVIHWGNSTEGTSWDAARSLSAANHLRVSRFNLDHYGRKVLLFVPRIFLSYIIDLGTHTIEGSASWRIPVGLPMLWGLILLSGIFFLPDSP